MNDSDETTPTGAVHHGNDDGCGNENIRPKISSWKFVLGSNHAEGMALTMAPDMGNQRSKYRFKCGRKTGSK